ncbi:MAG: polymer-forming cytoskeletal protein [Polyangiaceae bacterium]
MMFRRRTATIVGPETSLKGDLVCGDDDACIAGRLEGSIVSEARVVVVAGGQVRGDVLADVVVVAGVVRGSVIARKRLHMQATGRISGDAMYGTLEVDCGGVDKGRTCTMTEPPIDDEPFELDGSSRITADWSHRDRDDDLSEIPVSVEYDTSSPSEMPMDVH